MSFAGEIQMNIFNGLSIKNFLKTTESVKLMITYGEFNPGARSLYFFARDLEKPPKILSIQHGHANKNFMFFFHKKSEFTKNISLEGKFYSPSPDFYLTQGNQYNKILKSFFPKKTKIIGSLKDYVYKFKKNSNYIKLKKIKHKNKKKIVLICPSMGDEFSILDRLKKSVNYEYRFILSPHFGSSNKREIIKRYFDELGDKCTLEVYSDIRTIDLLSISSIVICGFSSVAYEALFFGAQSVRVIDPIQPQYFDPNDNLPIASSSYRLKRILNGKFYLKTNKTKMKKLIKHYYYKLDNKTHKRFWSYIQSI